jgi:hypothetical protein
MLLAVAGIVLGVGSGLRTFLGPESAWWSAPVTFALFVVGTILSILGLVTITRAGAVVLDAWNSDFVYKAIARAEPKSTISILQTSIPELTKLIGEIEQRLVEENKQFKLRVLLLNFKTATAIAEARVKLRLEEPSAHLREIETNIRDLIAMKRRVDQAWEGPRDGAELKLEIRLYEFLPFGSHYQIGNDVMYIGLFWNTTSSINGPMIRVTGPESHIWKDFEHQFEEGWRTAEPHYPSESVTVSTPPSVKGSGLRDATAPAARRPRR